MTLKFDFGDFERAARNFDAFADQVPFALAQAMNDGLEEARRELIDSTWPQHISARNKSFMGAALTTKGNRATKRDLHVAIEDRLGRASLLLHAEGGTRQARNANIAVPNSTLKAKRSGKGIPKGLRPRALPNSFRKGDMLYQRIGPKMRQLRPMYVLVPSVGIKADVPFERDFNRAFTLGMARAFGPRIRAAMATRRS